MDFSCIVRAWPRILAQLVIFMLAERSLSQSSPSFAPADSGSSSPAGSAVLPPVAAPGSREASNTSYFCCAQAVMSKLKQRACRRRGATPIGHPLTPDARLARVAGSSSVDSEDPAVLSAVRLALTQLLYRAEGPCSGDQARVFKSLPSTVTPVDCHPRQKYSSPNRQNHRGRLEPQI